VNPRRKGAAFKRAANLQNGYMVEYDDEEIDDRIDYFFSDQVSLTFFSFLVDLARSLRSLMV